MLHWLKFWRKGDEAIQDEIDYHLEMLTQDHVDRGIVQGEARYAARRKLGNATRAKEDTRGVWVLPALEELLQDVQYTLRSLRKSPAFFALVIAILALGLGTSVSVFSLVDGVLLRPLPYRDPQRLVALTTYAPKPPFDSNGSVSFRDFLQFKAKCQSFSDLGVTFRDGWSRVTLTGGSEPVNAQGAFVSANLFALAGRSPILGRMFTEEEDSQGERVVVISDALWADRFGSSRAALGQYLEMDHLRWRVIGVAPADFALPFLDTQVWAPVHSHPEWNSTEDAKPLEGARWDVVGRLRPGVSFSAAQAEVASIWSGLRDDTPRLDANDIRLVPLREHFSAAVKRPLWLLFGSVVFLLFIACVNVANLLVARSATRARELAVRSALGAGTGRLIRQLLTEALTLCWLAGVMGVLLSIELVPLLKALAPANTPLLDTVSLNGQGLVFALAVSVAVGMALGLAPLLRLRAISGETLNAAGRSLTANRGDRRLRELLVAGQFALATVLLTGAALFIRSFISAVNENPGFRPQNLVTVDFSLPDASDTQAGPIYQQILQRMNALPHVEAVGGTSNLFYLDEERTHALRLVEGRPPEPKYKWKPLVWTQITGEYFQAMGIPLIRGRFFDKHDRRGSPLVLIVNETLAHRYWPHEDPIGKRVKGFDARGQHDDWLTVVGVVGDVRVGGLERPPFSQIYELQSQEPGERISHIVIRTSAGDVGPLAAAARRIVHSVDRDAVISSASSMGVLLRAQETQRRFQTWLIGIFSAMALGLAALGIFAVMHYSVSARTSEIGIRMSAGATPGDIAGLMLAGGVRLAAYGIAVGALTATYLAKALSGFFYHVQPTDPVSFLSAALLLFGVAMAGAYLPANRASRIDPVQALRKE